MREKTRQQLNWLAVGLVCSFVVVYSLFEARNLMEGPVLTLNLPEKIYVSTKSSILEVRGNAKNILSLAVNNRPVLITPEGDFTDKLLLLPGYNRIAITAKDKFGRENIKIIEAVLTN
ncbi:MAG: hypothetical protein HZA94_00180 [Candidatus Vogelbacteria bacterium]|nr:hypothetical protein [Candidatus Vogelbacteria bacterium]